LDHLKLLFLLQVRPPDDTIYVRFASKNPKKTRWVFHGTLEKRGWFLMTKFTKLFLLLADDNV